MENLTPGIRNAARAVILREGSILLLRKNGSGGGERFALPGGAQDLGETLEQALNRECLDMARQADKLVRKSLSFIEKGRYERADAAMSELGELEVTLRKATKKTRLLNQLVGHLATRLRLDRFDDLDDDQVKQTVNSLERSSKLFGVVKKGAQDIIGMFDQALERASQKG